jgi:FeS assembly SUF system protein
MSDPVDTPTPVAPAPAETPASPAAVNGAAVSDVTVSDVAVSDDLARLTDEIVTAIKTVYDPEIPADVYELGLIYKIDIADDRAVHVEMTLTTPNCPSAQELPTMVENAVASVPGVGPVDVKVVWEPPWEPSRMSDEARVVLNMW